MSQLLLAYYADDFTGSTDALESLAVAGVPTMLFMTTPTPEQLSAYPNLRAIGVAGSTRSMPTEDLEAELRVAFPALRNLGARHVHYKVCSTFDSSPQVGSIGRAIEVGDDVFGPAVTPLVVASPDLGRYCAFGNLFARMGIGSDGAIHRLDRHPATINHPVTPANESDLRLYLGQQTDREVRLFDVLMHELSVDGAQKVFVDLVDGNPVLLFDALYPQHLNRVGQLVDSQAGDGSLFSVGSSAVETALVAHWYDTGILKEPKPWPQAEEVDRLLVLSGSCSPVTAHQIDWALANGFDEVAMDTVSLVRPAERQASIDAAAAKAVESLLNGSSVIVHTGRGANDERVTATRTVVGDSSGGDADVLVETSKRLSTALGSIGNRCLEAVQLERICLAGGDTSSWVARSLEIEALEMSAPLSAGAPLCKAISSGPANGVEFNFKGGQVGGASYFETVRLGKL